MALIKCPECGREKVSDTAEMCPDCGFGIRKYFENLKKMEIQEKERIQQEEIDKREMAKIPLPQKPKKPLFFADSDQNYINALKMYNLAQSDPAAYRRKILEAKRIVANAEAERWANIPKCPTCGSTSVKKLSAFYSTGFTPKYFECRCCGYMW